MALALSSTDPAALTTAQGRSEPPVELWRFGAGAQVMGEPAIGPDGRLYVGTAEGYLHALGADGQYLWSHVLLGAAVGAPAVSEHGIIYVGTAAGWLYALRSDGTLHWKFRMPSAVVSDVVIGSYGSLYLAEREHVFAVSPAAVAIWRKRVGGLVSAGPVVASRARILVGTRSGELVHLSWYDKPKTTTLPGAAKASPWLKQDGSVYVLAGETLVVFDRQGNELWGFSPAKGAAFSDQQVVVLGTQNDISWLSGEGVLLGRVTVDVELGGRIALGAEGRAYVSTAGGEVWAISSSGTIEQRLAVRAGPIQSLRSDSGSGRLVVLSGRGNLTAFSMPTAGN
jgi:outer membrane protein assembly factor BamB